MDAKYCESWHHEAWIKQYFKMCIMMLWYHFGDLFHRNCSNISRNPPKVTITAFCNGNASLLFKELIWKNFGTMYCDMYRYSVSSVCPITTVGSEVFRTRTLRILSPVKFSLLRPYVPEWLSKPQASGVLLLKIALVYYISLWYTNCSAADKKYDHWVPGYLRCKVSQQSQVDPKRQLTPR